MIESIHAPSLAAILPESIFRDEKLLASAKALDKELAKLSEAVIETLHLPRIDELPEHVVDFLGWQFHVENYGMSLPLEVKRELVKTSILVHRKKGTRYAIETTVSQFFSPVEAVPWYDYNGHPYTFQLKFQSYEGFSETNGLDFLRKIVNDVKSERDCFGYYINEPGISFERTDATAVHIGLATSTSSRQVAELARLPDDAASVFAGLHLSLGRHTRRIGAGARLPPDLAVTSSGMYGHKSRHVKVLFDPSDMPESVKGLLLPAAALPHISSVLTDGGGRRRIYTTMPENIEDILGIGLTDILGGHALIGTGSPKPDALFGTIGSVLGHSRHITVLAEARKEVPGTYDGTPYAAHMAAGMILSCGQGSHLVNMSVQTGTVAKIQHSLGLFSGARRITLLIENESGGLPSETCGIGSHAGLLHAGIMPAGLAVH